MKILNVILILFVSFNINAQNNLHSSEIRIEYLLQVHVSRVIDGDTIDVYIYNPPEGFGFYERVRLIGVDTPETVHPNLNTQFFGQEASEFTRLHLERKTVYLAFDRDLRDVYGRLLAYVYLADGICFNTILIKEGFGYAYTRFPFMLLDEFIAYETEARRKGKGLWAHQSGGYNVLQ